MDFNIFMSKTVCFLYGYFHCVVSPEGSVQISPMNILTNFNSNENLTCSAEGGPNNVFEWRQNGVVISETNDPILSFPMVTGSDGGVYQCTVTNAAGNDNNIATIIGR